MSSIILLLKIILVIAFLPGWSSAIEPADLPFGNPAQFELSNQTTYFKVSPPDSQKQYSTFKITIHSSIEVPTSSRIAFVLKEGEQPELWSTVNAVPDELEYFDLEGYWLPKHSYYILVEGEIENDWYIAVKNLTAAEGESISATVEATNLTNKPCLNDCAQNPHCDEGTCLCSENRAGVDCSIDLTEITSSVMSITLDPEETKFFFLEKTLGSGQSLTGLFKFIQGSPTVYTLFATIGDELPHPGLHDSVLTRSVSLEEEKEMKLEARQNGTNRWVVGLFNANSQMQLEMSFTTEGDGREEFGILFVILATVLIMAGLSIILVIMKSFSCCNGPRNRNYDSSEDDLENNGLQQDPEDLFPKILVRRLTEKPTMKCTICLEDFVPQNQVRRLSCSHVFHSKCIDIWFNTHSHCPLCQRNFSKGNEEAETHVTTHLDLSMTHNHSSGNAANPGETSALISKDCRNDDNRGSHSAPSIRMLEKSIILGQEQAGMQASRSAEEYAKFKSRNPNHVLENLRQMNPQGSLVSLDPKKDRKTDNPFKRSTNENPSFFAAGDRGIQQIQAATPRLANEKPVVGSRTEEKTKERVAKKPVLLSLMRRTGPSMTVTGQSNGDQGWQESPRIAASPNWLTPEPTVHNGESPETGRRNQRSRTNVDPTPDLEGRSSGKFPQIRISTSGKNSSKDQMSGGSNQQSWISDCTFGIGTVTMSAGDDVFPKKGSPAFLRDERDIHPFFGSAVFEKTKERPAAEHWGTINYEDLESSKMKLEVKRKSYEKPNELNGESFKVPTLHFIGPDAEGGEHGKTDDEQTSSKGTKQVVTLRVAESIDMERHKLIEVERNKFLAEKRISEKRMAHAESRADEDDDEEEKREYPNQSSMNTELDP